MAEAALTVQNLSQEVLDKVWLIWYRIGYNWDRDYPCCAPTPGMVRTLLRGDCLEWQAGLSDYRPAAIRIEEGANGTLMFTAIARIPESFDPDEKERIIDLLSEIMDEWQVVGIPTLPCEAVKEEVAVC